jgi:hypothetical protein
MPNNRYGSPPMTLANMRANGVSSLSATCEICHHEALMNVDDFEDAVPVPAIRPIWSASAVGSSAPMPGPGGRF